MNTRTLRLAAALSVSMLQVSQVVAQEYYRQNPVNSVGGYSSQDARNPGGLGWFSEVADNFPGESGWRIDRVQVWGGYVTDLLMPGNTRGFAVRFYSDNAGNPGERVYEADSFRFQRELYYQTPPNSTAPNGFGGYRYTIELPRAFALTSTAQYWMSVVAIIDRGGGSTEPQWGWVQALTRVGPSAQQWFFQPGRFAPVNVDVAFVLSQSERRCVADVDNGTGTGVPDGGVTLDDLLYYVAVYDAGGIAADIDDGTGSGMPDGGVTIDDLLYFVLRYEAGC